MRAALPLLLLLGCTKGEAQDSEDTGQWYPAEGGEITLTTRDDLRLVADYFPSEVEGAPAVVLVHMIPPNWDRTSWPDSFIQSLYAQGWSVLVPDRRGAGESEGEAVDAYLGEKGRYDVEACALKLQEDGAGELVVIGASNGTASALDYAVWAPDEGLPVPVGLGFMTGGSYTEANTRMSELEGTPAVFTYSTDERDWSVAQQAQPSAGDWAFLEYADGAHGTHMFEAEPSVADELVSWLGGIF
ncbi:MAG: alpha/beta hydrolase [Alphaproteobacteria bacterium]|nr:alpha/beta hydrolase [Alphaproteobacteria bacterium]MCB9796356.1 alpha/beta hydrolase [Alphaproteobacteria bacterium]